MDQYNQKLLQFLDLDDKSYTFREIFDAFQKKTTWVGQNLYLTEDIKDLFKIDNPDYYYLKRSSVNYYLGKMKI